MQQFVPLRTSGKLPRFLAQCADLIAQAICVRNLVHSQIIPAQPNISGTTEHAGEFQTLRTIFALISWRFGQ